ncbi:hypothetical protein ACEPAG_1956 [Sanghuangporus baumii]
MLIPFRDNRKHDKRHSRQPFQQATELINWLPFLYLLCFLDRIGIGNARLYGMVDDLNILDTQYLICPMMFFDP